MTEATSDILAVMQDLLFLVQIQDAARRVGLRTIAVKTSEAALTHAAAQPLLIVIDLNFSAAAPVELIRALKADPVTQGIHLLAFVSHVQTDLQAAAISHGCDTVVPRSAFARRLPEVISSLQPR